MSGSKRARSRKRRIAASGLALVVVVLALGSGGFVFAARLEENDAFCASCHSQPESAYYDRTQAAAAVDLASKHHDKAVTCIDCHAGPGLAGRLAAMTIGAGDLLHYVTNTAKQPAPLTVPIGDINCLKCHADVPLTRDFARHFHAFLSRWQAIDTKAATCVDCHTAHHTDGEAGLMFLQRGHTLSICQNCHNRIGEG